jgi:hypothetical protein
VVDLKTTGIQIVSSIIGSSLLLFAVTTFYSDFLNKPDVHAKLVHIFNNTSIELTNNGRVPATNLILTVQSLANDANFKIFTTENFTKILEDNHTLVVKFPRFVHGNGSLIRIEISAEQKLDAFDQSTVVYATYDQGSLRLPNQTQQPINIPFGLTMAFTIAALITFTIPYFYRRAKRGMQYWNIGLLFEIAENILRLKEYFIANPSDTSIQLGYLDKEHLTLNAIKGFFKNEADFYMISDFYTKLASRNIYVQKNFQNRLELTGFVKESVEAKDTTEQPLDYDNVVIQDLNGEIAQSADEAINKICWEEYGFSRIEIMYRVHYQQEALTKMPMYFRLARHIYTTILVDLR